MCDLGDFPSPSLRSCFSTQVCVSVGVLVSVSVLAYCYRCDISVSVLLSVSGQTAANLGCAICSPVAAFLGSSVAAFVGQFCCMQVLHFWVVLNLYKVISSRLFVVWGILWSFPEVRTHVLVSSLVISWSITEIIRYSFFGTKEALGFAPSWLLWLRWGNLKLQKSLVVVVRCWLDDAGGCGEMNRHLPNE
ncbi:hypothetical protein Vadar_018537 [Vaccinium darrowii]|uniref:Uncharacterized protein n=1 Tax=Vaccinium darrowii TaxID=229202 RepID=A0ACB7XZW6_9ERIC|nr:hypothetical protein Vadar_018537 [Vaccinium darrowii]